MGCELRTVSSKKRASLAAAPTGPASVFEASSLAPPLVRPSQSHPEVSQIERWRAALFRTVALGALMVYGGRPVQAACTGVSPAPLVCTGVITGTSAPGVTNGGILASNTFSTIDISALTANITPNSGVDGINIVHNSSAISITSDTGPYSIITTGNTNADGMDVSGSGTQSITIDHTGNITATGRGIWARRTGAGAVSVTTEGDITGVHGIFVTSAGGNVTIDSTGDVQGTAGIGIYALSTTTSFKTVEVTSDGNVSGTTWAIWAAAAGTGNVTVDSTGDLTTTTTATGATTAALYASSASGAVTVTTNGDITAANGTVTKGIYAVNAGAGTVTVKNYGGTNGIRSTGIGIAAKSTTGSVYASNTGSIRAATNASSTATPTGAATNSQQIGILAQNSSTVAGTTITVKNDGDITAFAQGIAARATGSSAITIESTGDISSTTTAASSTVSGASHITAAISAQTTSGANAINVTSTGNLTSNTMGIYARHNATGAVTVTNNSAAAGNSVTARTYGLFAQSAGGNVTIDTSGDVTSTNAMAIWAQSSGAGSVEVINNGDVTANTLGILARSSSGAGNVTVKSTGDISNSTTAGTLGIYARNSGIGTINVESTGNVTTRGTSLYARSSGGGNVSIASVGDVTSRTLTGIYGRSTSGNVVISSTGTIDTFGSGIFANATSGVISVESTGDITSLAYGIKSQGGTSSTINVDGGTVYGYYAAVQFVAGGTNVLNNAGALYTTSLTTGLAANSRVIMGSTGNDTVNNYGLVVGSVNLEGGTNAFNNKSSGWFYSGSTVNVGAGNTLTNEGVISPGGFGTIQTTALTGDFVQTGTGTFTVDIDQSAFLTSNNDLLTVSGTADFAGYVFANPIAISTTGSVLISTAAGGITTMTAEAVDTATTDFKLQQVGLNELWLSWLPMSVFDLFSGFLTPNQEATAIYLDTLRQAGPSAALLALIDAVKGLPNEAEILMAIDRLHPEHYLAQVNDTLHSSYFFVNSMMSCPTASGENAVTEGQCLWAKVAGRIFEQDRTNTNIGGDVQAYSVSAGAQVAMGNNNWRLGFAGSYEQTELTTNNDASSEGQRAQGGVVLKNRWGPATMATGVFGGYGMFDTARSIGLAGIDTAQGEQDIRFGGAHTRLTIAEQGNGWYIKPMLDLNATYIEYGGFTESGGGAAALMVAGSSDWVFSARPAVELGGNFEAGSTTLRPFVQLGFTYMNDAEFSMASSFVAAPAGVAPFVIASQFNNAFIDVAAGVDLLSAGGVELKINYDGRFSDDSTLHAGAVKAGVKF